MRRLSLRLPSALLALPFLIACAGEPRLDRPAFAAQPLTLTADSRAAFQRIEHFGASAAWWAQDLGTWPASARDAVLDLLFDAERGIGLKVVRYNLGGGKDEGRAAGIADPWRSAECPLRPDGSLDWSRDEAAMSVVDGAVARGAKVILFCNSPPAAMTVTGAPTGAGGACNLRRDAADSFASYLARCAGELSARWPLVALSPINEPQWDWEPKNGQEGCHYSPDEAAQVIAKTASALAREGLDLPILTPESGAWGVDHNRGYIEAVASSIVRQPELASSLGSYAVHSYWSGPGDRDALSSFFSLLPLSLAAKGTWTTEWTEMRAGKDSGMRAALVLADTVHDDLVRGRAASWQYWIAVSKYDYADGLLYVDPEARSFETTKKLWALGNWSRFVKPGARRLACDSGAARGLRVSAFGNPDGSFVFVVVNDGQRSTPPLSFRIAGTGRRPSQGRAWETSAARSLEEVPLEVDRPRPFPAASVTTVVLR